MAPRSPRTKRSPGRPRKSVVENIEKSLEKPGQNVLMGFEGVAFLFLLGGIAAAVAWMVYVAKFNLNYYTKVDDSKTLDENITPTDGSEPTIHFRDTLTVDQYTICYQAVVASLLLYFAFKYHFVE